MSEPRKFFVYSSKYAPSLSVFEKEQPDYMMKNCEKIKVIEVDKDIDSYIYFIQHNFDNLKKKYDRLEKSAMKLREASRKCRIYCLGSDCSTKNMIERFDQAIQEFDEAIKE